MLKSSALASLQPGLLGFLCPSSCAVTIADAAATRPVESEAAISHHVIPSLAAKRKNVPSMMKCNNPWTQRSASKGAPDSLGGLGFFDSPSTMSSIGPITQMKMTPDKVYAPPSMLPEIARSGLMSPRRCSPHGSGCNTASLIQMCVFGSGLSYFRSHYHHAVWIGGVIFEIVMVVYFCHIEVLQR